MKWQHDGKRLSTKSMQLSVLSFLRPFWTYCRQTATKIVFYKRWHTKSSQFHNLKIMPVSAPKGTAPSHLNVCWPVALTSQGVEVLFSYLSAICIPTKSDSGWCRAHSQKWMSCEDQALLQSYSAFTIFRLLLLRETLQPMTEQSSVLCWWVVVGNITDGLKEAYRALGDDFVG